MIKPAWQPPKTLIQQQMVGRYLRDNPDAKVGIVMLEYTSDDFEKRIQDVKAKQEAQRNNSN